MRPRRTLAWAAVGLLAASVAAFAAPVDEGDPSPPVRFLPADAADGPPAADPDRPRFAPVYLPPSPAPPGRGRLRALWAGADAPRLAVELDWDGRTIGHLGAAVPVLGPDHGPGYFLTLWPQLEVEGLWIPFQYWRGRIAVEVGRAFRRPPGRRFDVELSGGVMHESDHITFINPAQVHFERPVDAVVLNDVFGRLTLRGPLAHWDVVATFTPRLHLLTCTAPWSQCGSGTAGDATAGGAVDVVAVSLRPQAFGWAPFVSTRIEGHLARERALAEWRFALRMGLVDLYAAAGAWQLALGLRLGHPVGVYRGLDDWEGRGLFSLAWSH